MTELQTPKKQPIHTQFYQKHIISGIENLENRRDRYMSNRLQFLNQYCAPIQNMIDEIKEQIKYYENMRDTKHQVIENQPDILNLKGQIKQYNQTKQYYEQKLDSYEKGISILSDDIRDYRDIVEGKRMKVATFGSSLAEKSMKSSRIKHSNPLIHHFQSRSEEPAEQQQEQQNIKSSKMFPKIMKSRKPPSKYYVFSQQNKLKAKLHDSSLKSYLNSPSLNNLSLNNPQFSLVKTPQKINEQLSEEEIKKIIKQFDKTEALFRECFQRKKLTIQKSVTQLQSKLITNKQTFLQVCQAIGGGPQKLQMSSSSIKKINYEQFMSLTPDQLMTIFISFSWLNRRMYGEFSNKRRLILNQIVHKKKYFHGY